MKKTFILVGVVILLGAGWYLLSPLFIDTRVDETFPDTTTGISETSLINEEMTSESTVEQEDVEVPETGKVSEVPEPLPLLSGVFEDVDIVHKGKGSAEIYLLPSGSKVLRLEDFEVTNGPGLHIILSAHPRPRSSADVKDMGYLDLGNLKGNIGNQNYTLPDSVDIPEFKSVVIYCYPFNVVFSTAMLE